MSDINDIQHQINAFCNARDWSQFHNLKDVLISLTLESAEALEHVQWKNEDELKALATDNTALGEELADVLYWTILAANKANIDLNDAFHNKMVKNELKYPVYKAKGSHKKYTELS